MSRPRHTTALATLMLAIGGALAWASPAQALPASSIDPGFNGGSLQRFDATFTGRFDEGEGVAVQSNGRILVAGRVSTGGRYVFGVSRFTAAGAPDTSWGGGDGVATASFTIPGTSNAEAWDVAVRPDGTVVAVGFAETGGATGTDFVVAQFTASGVLDTSFDADGNGWEYVDFPVSGVTDPNALTDKAYGLALDSAGRIAVGGWAHGDFAVARLAPDASSKYALDPAFSGDGRQNTDIAGGFDVGRDVAIATGDAILLGGSATVGSGKRFALARYRSDGTLDTGWGTNGLITAEVGGSGDDVVHGLAVEASTQKIVATGTSAGSNGDRIIVARYLATGAPDASWNGGAPAVRHVGLAGYPDFARDVAIDAKGRTIVVGTASATTSRKDAVVLRYLSDGRLDPTWSSDGIRWIPNGSETAVGHAVALHGTNIIVAGGAYQSSTNLETSVVRLLGEPLAGTADAFTGCEHRAIDVGSGRTFSTAAGTSIDTTVRRAGGAACRTQGSFQLAAGSANARVVRAAVHVTALPATEQVIVETIAGGTDTFSIAITPTGVMRARIGTSAVDGPTITPGTWHLLELRADASLAERVLGWRVDDVGQTSVSITATAAASTSSPRFRGSSAAPVVFDDIAISNVWSDYPLGDGQAIALGVNGVGTHAPAGAPEFRMHDGSALGSTSWTALDERPAGTADYVRQVTANSASYAEFQLANTPFTTAANGVRGVVAFHSPVVGTNAGRTDLVTAGGVATAVQSGDMGAQTSSQHRAARVPTPSATWTPAQLNGLRARVGFSTDIDPEPRWDALLAEVDVPVNVQSIGVATQAPSIPGTPTEGRAVTAVAASWTGAPTGIAYQWRRCDAAGGNCGDIAGATSQTYTPTAADVNVRLRVRETATWETGTNSVTSARSAVVLPVPQIIDNQSGDTAWRASNVATYDVDFTDANGLTRLVVTVHGSPGQTGTKRQDWTEVAMLSGTSYTTNWQLPASTWAALAEGSANYVSVGVTNSSGQTTTLTDAFTVAKDTVGPTAVTTLSAPSPTTVDPALGWSAVTDAGSGLASYRVYRGSSATAMSPIASTNSLGHVDTSALSGQVWYYRIGAVDAVGNESAVGNTIAVTYNREPSMPTLVSPAHDAINVSATPTLQATFDDPDLQVGNVQFQVCSDSACTTTVHSGSSPSVASGSTASWSPPGLLAGTRYWWRALATDGLASSPLTTPWSFVTDSTAPSIIDNQAGDETWRTANDGSYDVDFSDAVALTHFDVEVWSGAGQTGTKLQAWTKVSDIGGTLHDTDWLLPASTWMAMQPGLNYVSVRVWNSALVETTLVDAFEVRIDTTPPPAITALAAPTPTVELPTLSWPAVIDGTSDVAYYRVYGADAAAGPWTTQLNVDGDTRAGSWTDPAPKVSATRYYMVRAVDRAGHAAGDSNVVGVHHHRAPAATSATTPADGVSGVSPSPTLGASHVDEDGDAGTVTFEVCSDPACTGVVRTGDSPSGIASGDPGTWAVTPALAPATTYWWRSRSTDAWGAVGPEGPARSFTTSSGPAITDRQPGDETWRRVNDGTYDVDFADPLDLDRIEVRVFDGPGQAGTLLQDWTPVSSSLAGTSLTANWSLPASTWEAMVEGSNHVSIRAWNDANIASTLSDAFIVKRDTLVTAPSAVGEGGAPDLDWSASMDSLAIGWAAAGGEAIGSGIDRYEYCVATGAGCTGTIAAPWATAGPSTSINAIGLALADGTTYVSAVRTVDAAGNTSGAASSDGVTIDASGPTGSIDATPPAPWSGIVRVTGTADDAGIGIASISVAYAGPDSGSMPDPECAAATVATWAEADSTRAGCDWDTTSVDDGEYVISAILVDALGTPTTVTRTVLVDNSAPTITDARFVEQGGGAGQHAVNCAQPCVPQLWYRPAGSGSVDLVVAGIDGGTGIASVGWPDLDATSGGGGWTPDADVTAGASSPFTRSYSWAQGATAVSPLYVQLVDVAGNPATAQVAVTPDSTAPRGATIASTEGAAVTSTVTFDVGSDGQSGIASHHLERRATTRSGSTGCEASGWGSWATVTPPGVASPWTDPSPARDACHQYRIVVEDNVGNAAPTTSAGTLVTESPGIIIVETDGSTNAIERGATDTYAVSLRAAPTADVVVALDGDGQVAPSPATLTFTPGDWSTPREVTATAVDDDIDEAPDVMSASIRHAAASADAGYQGLGAALTASVTDNDLAGLEVQVDANPTVVEGGANERVRVRLTSRPVTDVAVVLTGDADVRPTTPTLAFTPATWNTWQAVAVAAVDDTIAERTPHSGRLGIAARGDDPAYATLAARRLDLAVRDDDPARLATRAGAGWNATGAGHVRLAETGEPTAQLVVYAVGDPTRDIVVTPVLSSTDDLAVTPASVRIEAGSHLQAATFTFHAVDDRVAEATPHRARIAWRVATVDPLYDTATLAAIDVEIADGAENVTRQESPPGTTQDPAPATPTERGPVNPAPTRTPDDQPPGTTVGRTTGTTPSSRTPRETTPVRSIDEPRRGIARRVRAWAADHPVAAAAAASAGGIALLAAKPLALAGKGLAGGGFNMPGGIEELKRLLRNRRGTSWWKRVWIGKRFRRRRREDDEVEDDDDDDWWWLENHHAA